VTGYSLRSVNKDHPPEMTLPGWPVGSLRAGFCGLKREPFGPLKLRPVGVTRFEPDLWVRQVPHSVGESDAGKTYRPSHDRSRAEAQARSRHSMVGQLSPWPRKSGTIASGSPTCDPRARYVALAAVIRPTCCGINAAIGDAQPGPEQASSL
jgi:hypothetical protein